MNRIWRTYAAKTCCFILLYSVGYLSIVLLREKMGSFFLGCSSLLLYASLGNITFPIDTWLVKLRVTKPLIIQSIHH